VVINRFIFKNNIFIIALQEAFITVIPYLFISSLITLIISLLRFYDLHLGLLGSEGLEIINNATSQGISLVVMIAIASRFAIRFDIDNMMSIMLSVSVFFSVSAFSNTFAVLEGLKYAPKINSLSILIPIVTVFVFRKIMLKTNDPVNYSGANVHIYRVFRYIRPLITSYLILVVFFLGLVYSGDRLAGILNYSGRTWPDGLLLGLRAFISQFFWMIGLNGPHTVNAFFSTDFLSHEIFPGLTYGIFFRIFAVSGGSGMGLSLLVALFLNYRDFHDKYLLKMSAPFVFFNINTMIIFGLPVIFNPFLLIPFIFLPLLNISIAYFVLNALQPVISGVPISWVTPVFLDAYLASGGNVTILLLQFFLIGLSVAIYYPFVRNYIRSQNPETHLVNIEKSLDINLSLQMKDSLAAFEAQRSIIQSSYELEKLSRYLSWKNLILYYQPKVDTKAGECHSFEALLRLKQPDGKILGPSFLEHVERAGLSAVIDFWVCQKVKSDMTAWEKEGFNPCIGINLHPDTLQDKNIMKQIIDSLKGMNVEFEIIERSLLDNVKARSILRNLQKSGFRIAIDDFGVGHSNFDTISYFNIDTVKIDKSLIDIIYNPRSFTVCKHIVQLCTELGIVCIAEGVESKEQLELLHTIDVSLIQGFYISKAIPPDEVIGFNCKKRKRETADPAGSVDE